eukprot:CAMPEP_0198328914 /NCGR_PEP_ID=MMETSP1450-20131203/15807_1 /TAXON_ID=753684 ORGANISM="Madagascaria erythrocladiodes, Strain CCMP3234" /NCGR_SAMPLE_ID=MMETSP1450 /ASSEMBLY_ACC=CAM_ASM_001115 /LENGTH=179 /DNA_ID=CAMNT_0044033077 /DNA_START=58 /DNA_END=594 /DNA_ORIENTATION=+
MTSISTTGSGSGGGSGGDGSCDTPHTLYASGSGNSGASNTATPPSAAGGGGGTGRPAAAAAATTATTSVAAAVAQLGELVMLSAAMRDGLERLAGGTTELSFWCKRLMYSDVLALANALKTNSSLKKLEICGIGFVRAVACTALAMLRSRICANAAPLPRNTRPGNDLGVDGARALADA